jgi:DNA primase
MEWRIGNPQGDAGDSMVIDRSGSRAGRWCDFATGLHGDMLDLINHALFGGCDLVQAMKWASAWLGLDPSSSKPKTPPRESRPKPQQCDDDETAIGAARNIWSAAQPIPLDPNNPARRYLIEARKIEIEILPATLRFHPALTHYETGLVLPALVAAISGPDHKVTALQRIFLRPDGSGKADVSSPKMTLGRMRDGACRLAPAGRELGLSEGIETGLSAMELYHVPVWAACGSRIDQIAIPEGVDRVIIFADRGEAGVHAAEKARARFIAHRPVAIVPPPEPFGDWNDFITAERAA